MIVFDTVFRFSRHFLGALVSFISTPLGVMAITFIVAFIIVSIFNSLRR